MFEDVKFLTCTCYPAGALNIMRGRDSGLPDYNTVRKCFQLDPVTSWEEINPELYSAQPKLVDEVKDLYGGNLMNVDL